MGQIGPKQAEWNSLDQNRAKMSLIDQNVPKWAKQFGPKWAWIGQSGPTLAKMNEPYEWESAKNRPNRPNF